MLCCVPGCSNLHPEWTSELPRDDQDLLERWMQAILVGTGHSFPVDHASQLLVCNLHFELPQGSVEADNFQYQEPTLFNRNNILLQVASCRLCLRYDIIDNMFDERSSFANGVSLQWMTDKYFRIPSSRSPQGYFCESCTVRLDMTHNFYQDITENFKLHLKLTEKMETRKRVLKKPYSAHNEGTGKSETFPRMNDFSALDQQQSCTQISTHNDVTPMVMLVEKFKLPKMVSQLKEESSTEHISVQIKQETTPTDEPPGFACHICNTKHNTRVLLVQHLLIDHPHQEFYNCEKCQLSYKNIEIFNFHLNAHAHGRILKCGYCPKTFRVSREKIDHEFRLHRIIPRNAMDPKIRAQHHKCLVCDKKFSRKSK